MSSFTPQQQAAITGRGNLLVVAGAGTGKTQTLIARCLRLITEDRASLENILMVTFTEAAAAEMRGRLREQLREAAAAHPDDGHLAQQLALLDTARISTLHSFCLQLAREHFHALGLDPQFNVLDESQTAPLQREALDGILERHYNGADAESPAVQSLVRAAGRGADKVVRKLVEKIHAYAQSLPEPEKWLDAQQERFARTEPLEWRELFTQAVADLRDEWLGKIKSIPGETPALQLTRLALENLPAKPAPASAAERLRAIAAADVPANWPRGTKGKFRDPLKEFFDGAEFLGSLAPDAGGNDPLAQDWAWARGHMTALVALTREFAGEFATRKRDLGGVDFTDLEQAALRLLRDEAVAAEWRARLAHIFVDEYQDINAAQDAILTALSREGAEASRFLVGDVKQSIYRFRLANPRIFSGYAARWGKAGGGGKRIPLTENFRSREAVLDFVNPLFASLMGETGGVDYEPLEFGARADRAQLAAKPGDAPAVELHLIAKAETNNGDEASENDDEENPAGPDLPAVEREARLVARRLRELKDGGFEVWDKEKEEFRAVRWADMAVLLRSPTGRAEAFAMEFARAGVPLTASRDGFFASLEIGDLLGLLKLLDNPLQDVPLLAVLRSPLAGLTLEELAEIRMGSAAEDFWTALQQVQSPTPTNREQASKVQGEQPALAEKVKSFLAQIQRWRELARLAPLSQCLETTLAETGYEALLLAGERGPERVANVRKLLELARQFDPFQRQGLHRFLRFVRLQEAGEMDLPPAPAPAGDAVQLVSIHKSKGLEFPVVALAGLGTHFNERDLSGPVLLDETLGLCPKIFPPDAEQNYPGLTHHLARRTAKHELRGEELRLLYVALTRARDCLILTGTTNRKADNANWKTADESEAASPASARSHLDWLLAWLPQVTEDGQWQDGRSGQNALLQWRIYDGDDEVFRQPEQISGAEGADKIIEPDAGALEKLQARLEWKYSFGAATERAAKSSVSELRRRAADEVDDEAGMLFPLLRPAGTPAPPGAESARPKRRGRLSAAEYGTAHHLFLQLADLKHAGSEAELRTEAERLRTEGLISAEQFAALELKSLAAFWRDGVGGKFRAQAAKVKRELAFTARFSPVELDEVTGSPQGGVPAGEFVVVQGVADLVALLPDEIWLLDFKTDDVDAQFLAEKTRFYEPQLKLYALALARIYGRPVTQSWLHFLAPGESVPVTTATVRRP
jgi:ATP-dependent helicase/nuclease subunit A